MNAALQSRSFRFETDAAPLPAAPPPTLELSASDGTGLALVSLSARIVVDDPLAFTELALTFENPEDRRLEGRFRIALPGGASVSRFAMRIGSSWQEGEVVERQAARRAYEDFLHRKQDPALLEHEAGNEFGARVFPIEPRERKELILSYSHELVRPGEPYRLPLRGLPPLGSLSIRAVVGRPETTAAVSSLGGTATSRQVIEVEKSGWTPDADFEITPPATGAAGMRHADLAVVRVQPALPVEPDEVSSLLVLVDTSASRALGHEVQTRVVASLVAGLAAGAGAAVPLAVACFDQEVELVFEGTAGGFSPVALAGRLALGASDLVGALRWAASRSGARYDRLVLVSDGIGTAGDASPEALVAAARATGGAGVGRIDAIAVGGIRDDRALKRLVTAGLSRDGTVCDGDRPASEIAARLVRATRSGLAVEVPGASWTWPARLDGVQPGDAALVYAELPAGAPLRVNVGGTPAAIPPGAVRNVERPLLERAWVKARLDKLEDLRAQPGQDRDVSAGLQRQIVDLSVKHRVLSPYTALLVLETEHDYHQYGIDRRALADILTVGLSGVEVLHRKGIAAPPRAPAVAKAASVDGMSSAHSIPLRTLGGRSRRREFIEDELISSSQDELATSSQDSLDAMEMSEQSVTADERSLGDVQLSSLDDEIDMARMAPRRLIALDVPVQYEDEDDFLDREPSAPRAAEPAASMSAPAPAAYAPPPAPAPQPTDRAHRLMDAPPAAAPRPATAAPARAAAPATPAEPAPNRLSAWEGPLREIMALLLDGKPKKALAKALAWRQASPGDVLALVALGEAAEALGDVKLAARAYGAIIDLFPSRADLRRYAGERLSRLTDEAALTLAVDTFTRAVESRPDHPSSHRLLGMSLLRRGRYAEAFEAIAVGQARSYPPRFPGVDRILAEDLGLCAAALLRADPSRKDEILGRLRAAGAKLEDAPSVRFVLVWETDANDVDFHIHDAHGGHAYYGTKQLPSGGELYADITQGYGPECFTIRGAPDARAYPYRLQAHYFSRGPMGYGMGSLQIIEHDGQGGLVFEERPYVVMFDRAYVDLGEVKGPLVAAP